ncbi:MAG: glycine cleavage T C-terminal barrel domain-containing protein, partial [Pseudomonadota bacterium]
ALLARREKGPVRSLVTLEVDHRDAPAHPGASIMFGSSVAGTVTSGDWGHRVGLNLAYAFLDPARAAEGHEVQIDMCGHLIPARVIASGPYDPAFDLLRS